MVSSHFLNENVLSILINDSILEASKTVLPDSMARSIAFHGMEITCVLNLLAISSAISLKEKVSPDMLKILFKDYLSVMV
jgi:hypothetical protein